ncbi:MAG: DNA cytosine methyltransferase [Candidatus Acidiferrales bacterium]
MTSSRTELKKNVARRPIGIDLFAGAGGLSLGFEQAGFDVAAAVEIDPIHCAVHEYNFPNCGIVCTDASKTNAKKIREAAGLNGTPIDAVFGGAPCQGFSLIGHRALDDPRNRLILEFVRLTVELDAPYFVLENVKGLTIGDHRRLLDELIETFDGEGYNALVPYSVLNAADFGVPQDRRRLFLMGAKKGLPLPSYPKNPGGKGSVTVWQAIGDLPDVDQYPELVESDAVAKAKFGKGSVYARVLRGLAEDAADLSYPREWDASRLTSSMRTDHTPLSERRFKKTAWGTTEPVSRFLKLHPDGICNTLRAGTGSDRGAFTSPRPIHPHSPRCITVREAARLHSYPDWFRFHATKWHGFRQIGNSVPPLLGRAVAAELARAMGIETKRPMKKMRPGDESLLWMTMSQAAERYGVPDNVVGRRLRQGEKSKTAA